MTSIIKCDVVDAIVGMSSVKRFHGRSTIHQQTVADHSCRTAQIGFFIALDFYKGSIEKANSVAAYALFHDFPESLLQCDVSNPVKCLGGIGAALREQEILVVNRMFEDQHIRNLMLENAPTEDYQLIKLADILDFGLYIWEEVNFGNRTFIPMLTVFSKAVEKYPSEYLNLPFVQQCISKILG